MGGWEDLYSDSRSLYWRGKWYAIDNHAHLWAAPNGKIFHAGLGETMHWIDVTGNGSYTDIGRRGDAIYSMNMNTVMYDVGKIMAIGGANAYSGPAGKANSYIIDFNDENNVAVTRIADLNQARTLANTIALPNGQILVIGGASSAGLFTDAGSIFEPEIYDPSTNTWTELAPMTIPRRYHASVLLMADGRVLTAGGGLCSCSANHSDMQIFSPPYLFNSDGSLATRPTLNAPGSASYSSTMTVTGSDNITTFSMVRMSPATHSNNNEQRRIPLAYSKVGTGTYSLMIPDANILVPGYYMLFAMNAAGVPSISEAVQVGSSNAIDLSGSTACATENSGFEYMGNGINFGGYKQYNAGAFFNDFWDVTAGFITVHSNFHRNLGRDDNLGGIFHISLASGTMKQILTGLVPGETYELSLDYAVHDLATVDPSISISVGTDLIESFTASNRGNTDGWLNQTYSFVATAATMDLLLQGTATPVYGGMLVDNVTVCRISYDSSSGIALAFDTPYENEIFPAGSSIGAVISVSDSNGTISHVKLYLDGNFVRQESFAPYEWGTSHLSVSDPELENLPAGSYTLTAEATDNDGNVKEDSVSITVGGTTPPPVSSGIALSFVTPSDNENFAVGSSIGALVSAADSNGTISHVKLYLNGGFVRQESFEPYEWGESHPSVSDPELENLPAGTYTLLAEVTDNDGNVK